MTAFSVTVSWNSHCCSIERLISEDGYSSTATVQVTVFIKLIFKQTVTGEMRERGMQHMAFVRPQPVFL